MNHAVDGEHRSPRDVAREFVSSIGSHAARSHAARP
jgi:hypothetical protein